MFSPVVTLLTISAMFYKWAEVRIYIFESTVITEVSATVATNPSFFTIKHFLQAVFALMDVFHTAVQPPSIAIHQVHSN